MNYKIIAIGIYLILVLAMPLILKRQRIQLDKEQADRYYKEFIKYIQDKSSTMASVYIKIDYFFDKFKHKITINDIRNFLYLCEQDSFAIYNIGEILSKLTYVTESDGVIIDYIASYVKRTGTALIIKQFIHHNKTINTKLLLKYFSGFSNPVKRDLFEFFKNDENFSKLSVML